MKDNDIRKLHAALLTNIPDIQVQIERDRILFISTKFFLEVKDKVVSMSVLASPITKFLHIDIERTIAKTNARRCKRYVRYLLMDIPESVRSVTSFF